MLTDDQIRGLVFDVVMKVHGAAIEWGRCRPTVNDLWKVLCEHGVHDYEFVVINQKGALLRCFYCDHEKISTQSWMKHLDKPREEDQ